MRQLRTSDIALGNSVRCTAYQCGLVTKRAKEQCLGGTELNTDWSRTKVAAHLNETGWGREGGFFVCPPCRKEIAGQSINVEQREKERTKGRRAGRSAKDITADTIEDMRFGDVSLLRIGEQLLSVQKEGMQSALVTAKQWLKESTGLPVAWQDACVDAVVELRYRSGGKEWGEIADMYPERPFWIGPSYHLQWRDGVPILAFGKHENTPLHQVAADNKSYLAWILDQDFPEHVVGLCSEALHRDVDALCSWAEDKFGSPPS